MATRKSAAKTAVKKAAAKKTAAKAPAKTAAAKKAPARKAAAKKAPAKKAAAKKAPARTSARAAGMTVDQFVKKLGGDARADIITELRSLIREAAPDATESIKWGQPVYEFSGPFAFINAYKKHVNFGFWRGAELLDPRGMLKGSGNRMRHVELKSVADIDRPILASMVRTAIAMNHAKGDPTKRGARR
jgi:hypothetical protein